MKPGTVWSADGIEIYIYLSNNWWIDIKRREKFYHEKWLNEKDWKSLGYNKSFKTPEEVDNLMMELL